MTDATDESTARLADEYPSPAASRPNPLPLYSSPVAQPHAEPRTTARAQSGVGVRPVEPRPSLADDAHSHVEAPPIGVAPIRPPQFDVASPTHTGTARAARSSHMMAIGVGVQPHIDLEEVAINSVHGHSTGQDGRAALSPLSDVVYSSGAGIGRSDGRSDSSMSGDAGDPLGSNAPIAATGLVASADEGMMVDTLSSMPDVADFDANPNDGFDDYDAHSHNLGMSTDPSQSNLQADHSNDVSHPTANAKAISLPSATRPKSRALNTFYHPTPQPGRLPTSLGLSHAEQITILREAFLRNPLPNRQEMQELAEKTGRPAGKVREYFRQRRSKGRGLEMLEELEEPARAAGWLQHVFRPAPSTTSIPQLALYGSYKDRFDPYSQHSPLLGGQELIQMALATFPGCEMAKDEGEYVLRGLGERDAQTKDTPGRDGQSTKAMHDAAGSRPAQAAGQGPAASEHHGSANHGVDGDNGDIGASETLKDALDRMQTAATAAALTATMPAADHASASALHQTADDVAVTTSRNGAQSLDGLVEPLRATSWLLNQYDETTQPHTSSSPAATSTTNLALAPGAASMPILHAEGADINTAITQADLYTAYMHRFSQAHPSPTGEINDGHDDNDNDNDHDGKDNAVISPNGRSPRILNPVELLQLVRITFPSCEPAVDDAGRFVVRGLERREGVRDPKRGDMFPFALADEPAPSDPLHPLTSIMKRKLGGVTSDGELPGENGDARAKRYRPGGASANKGATGEELEMEDKQLVEGLQRFRHSKLGEQVRDVCISQ